MIVGKVSAGSQNRIIVISFYLLGDFTSSLLNREKWKQLKEI